MNRNEAIESARKVASEARQATDKLKAAALNAKEFAEIVESASQALVAATVAAEDAANIAGAAESAADEAEARKASAEKALAEVEKDLAARRNEAELTELAVKEKSEKLSSLSKDIYDLQVKAEAAKKEYAAFEARRTKEEEELKQRHISIIQQEVAVNGEKEKLRSLTELLKK